MPRKADAYADQFPEAALAPADRLVFMNRFTVTRADTCISCGMCESLCPYGVHKRIEGHARILPPDDRRCIGPSCDVNYFFCVANCPTNSLSVKASDNFASMGDPRWSAEVIMATWKMAETGRPIRSTTRPTRELPAEGSTSSTSDSQRSWSRATRRGYRRPWTSTGGARARGYASRSRSTGAACRSAP